MQIRYPFWDWDWVWDKFTTHSVCNYRNLNALRIVSVYFALLSNDFNAKNQLNVVWLSCGCCEI